MPKFISRNRTTLVMAALAAIVVLFLLILDVEKYIKIQNAMDEIDAGDKAIQEINDAGQPAPGKFEPGDYSPEEREKEFRKWDVRRLNPRIVKKNAELIQKDAADLAAQTRKLQRVYGQIYDKAFGRFLENLQIPVSARPVEPPEVKEKAKEEVKAAQPAPAANPEVKAVQPAPAAKPEVKAAQPAPAAKPEVKEEAKAVEPKILSPEDAELEESALKEMKEKWTFSKLSKKLKTLIPQKRKDARNISLSLFSALRKDLLKDLKEPHRKIAAEHFDYAFGLFRKDIQEMTVEDALSPESEAAQAAFLQTLGFPRTMSGKEFLIYSDTFQKKILENDAVPMISVDKPSDIRSFLMFLEKGKSVSIPPPENIPQIIRRFQIFEDLFARIKKSGAAALINIRQADGCDLFGRWDRNAAYRVYSYTVQLRGSLPQIRKFFNLLHQAYQDNRVYVVTSLALQTFKAEQKSGAGEDEVEAVVKMIASAKQQSEERKRQEKEKEKAAAAAAAAQQQQPGARTAAQTAKDTPAVPEAKPFDETESPYYGASLLGNNDQLLATFSFDYIVYEGDSVLKKNAH